MSKIHVPANSQDQHSQMRETLTFKVKTKDTGQYIALDNGNVVLVSGAGSAVDFMDDGKKWQISSSQFLSVSATNRVIVASSENTSWNTWTSPAPIKYNGKDVYVIWDATLNKYVLQVYTDSTTGPDFEAV